ncbi:putative boron transporter 2, partial [Tetrabaena socialis]
GGQEATAAAAGTAGGPHGCTLPLRVVEQRLSNLLQSLGVAACLFAAPAIRQIPEVPWAALWGYFAFMAIESFQGSQLVDRALLLLTDPSKRGSLLTGGPHAPYLETVPYATTAAFTLLQILLLAGLWALVTWAGVAGIAFPLPIMALVPVRRYLLPRVFRREHLAELDAAEYEQAPPASPPLPPFTPLSSALDSGPAVGDAAAAAGGAAGAADREAEREVIAAEHAGLQPVHHLTRSELRQ